MTPRIADEAEIPAGVGEAAVAPAALFSLMTAPLFSDKSWSA
jgi:hypothetical protein